jgi:RNA-directed DNA polymerase
MTADLIKAQQGLARKAPADQAHRFDDLDHLRCTRAWIEAALRQVLDNDGSPTPGVDGMSWKDCKDAEKRDFENEQFRQHFLEA